MSLTYNNTSLSLKPLNPLSHTDFIHHNSYPMDPILNTPLKKPSESSIEQETTPQTLKLDQKSPNSIENTRKNSTPDILKVPKAFKHPERYMSPTDLMMSPVSKGLLARARKTGMLIPPSNNPPKTLDQRFQDVSLFRV